MSSTELHGLDPGQHLAKCRDLIAQGARPVSLSVGASSAQMAKGLSSGQLVAASVWHRPMLEPWEKDRLVRRQANAAVALLKLDRPDAVWPLFQHKPDPSVRSHLIHRLGPVGVDPRTIVRRLDDEQDVSARRALLLGLGDFGDQEWSPNERDALLPKLLDLYRHDPDPGIHGAVGWLLSRPQWKHTDKLKEIDRELAKTSHQCQTGEKMEKRRWFVNSQDQTFAIISGGDFLMGSPRNEFGREGADLDSLEILHRRRIGRTFALATHEVTLAQFLRFGVTHEDSEPDHPVDGVTWYQAAAYCNWLSDQEKIPKDQWCYEPNREGKYAAGMKLKPNYLSLLGYRLPTEAEWEYACRARAVTSRYFGGSEDLLGHYAGFLIHGEGNPPLRAVGTLKPNDLGLFDMLGNASEWTQDRQAYYVIEAGAQPTKDRDRGEEIADSVERIVRGGSPVFPTSVRCAQRSGGAGGLPAGPGAGFRPARTLPLGPTTVMRRKLLDREFQTWEPSKTFAPAAFRPHECSHSPRKR